MRMSISPLSYHLKKRQAVHSYFLQGLYRQQLTAHHALEVRLILVVSSWIFVCGNTRIVFQRDLLTSESISHYWSVIVLWASCSHFVMSIFPRLLVLGSSALIINYAHCLSLVS